MKKILAVTMTTILLALSLTACGGAGSSAFKEAGDYIGTWAEESAERVIMMVRESEDMEGYYDIVVTWREDLPQKDMYFMHGKLEDDGTLTYTDCIYVIRYYEDDETYSDEVDYTNGTGVISYDDKTLSWTERDGETDEVTSTKFIKADDLAIEWPATEIVVSNE